MNKKTAIWKLQNSWCQPLSRLLPREEDPYEALESMGHRVTVRGIPNSGLVCRVWIDGILQAPISADEVEQ